MKIIYMTFLVGFICVGSACSRASMQSAKQKILEREREYKMAYKNAITISHTTGKGFEHEINALIKLWKATQARRSAMDAFLDAGGDPTKLSILPASTIRENEAALPDIQALFNGWIEQIKIQLSDYHEERSSSWPRRKPV